ncbi:MAG: STAS/SEC14 domain-containing protein [Flavobacteriales bacterium]
MNATDPPTNVLLRQDDYVTMQAVPSERMITLTWTGYAPSVTYRSILNEALNNVKALDLLRWLADLRHMDAIMQQDEQWTTTDWFPQLARTGLKRMAILTSADYFNRMSVDRIMTAATAEMPLALGYFEDIDKAKAWLLSTEHSMEPAK